MSIILCVCLCVRVFVRAWAHSRRSSLTPGRSAETNVHTHILIWRLINRGRWYKHGRSPSCTETLRVAHLYSPYAHREAQQVGSHTVIICFCLHVANAHFRLLIQYITIQLNCCSGGGLGSPVFGVTSVLFGHNHR